jgi:hypothetical protein
MISIIQVPSVDVKTARLAATVISADASFNARVAERKKRAGQDDGIFRCIDFAEEVLVECRALASEIANGLDGLESRKRLATIRDKIAGFAV